MRRLLVIALIALVGCTPAQTSFWLRWHSDDPEAAVAFLDTEEGQALLVDEGGSDGPQYLQELHAQAVEPGNCESYWPLMQSYGLPRTFVSIAWRESGCRHGSFVRDHDDLGGGLLGLNLRAGAAMWFGWCGLTINNVTDAETNVRSAAAAYQRLGLSPWR